MKEQPKPGEKVKFTGTFLAQTGQQTGNEGAKKFTVRECSCSLCKGGSFVAVDEEPCLDLYTADELRESPHLRWRHIGIANLMPFAGPKALRHEYFEIPVMGKVA